MTLYKPATAHSNSIVRPACTKCGTATLLFGIEAGRPPMRKLRALGQRTV